MMKQRELENGILLALYEDEKKNGSPRFVRKYDLVDQYYKEHIAGALVDDAVKALAEEKLIDKAPKGEIRLIGKGRIKVEDSLPGKIGFQPSGDGKKA